MAMFNFVEKHIVGNKAMHEKDSTILAACLEASKACHSLGTERKLLDEHMTQKGQVSLEKMHQVFKVFCHFLESEEKLQKLPQSSLLSTDYTFSDIVNKDDEVIMGCWAAWAQKLVDSLKASGSALQETLGPAVDWKQGLTAEASLDDVIAQADKTIMTMKGKRITMLKDQLGQARAFFGVRVMTIKYFLLFGLCQTN